MGPLQKTPTRLVISLYLAPEDFVATVADTVATTCLDGVVLSWPKLPSSERFQPLATQYHSVQIALEELLISRLKVRFLPRSPSFQELAGEQKNLQANKIQTSAKCSGQLASH